MVMVMILMMELLVMTRAMRMVMLLMPAWYKMMMWRNRWRMRKRITNLARTMYNYGYTHYKCFSADGCGNEGYKGDDSGLFGWLVS